MCPLTRIILLVGSFVRACVNLIILDVDNWRVHGINKGFQVPFWNTFHTDSWWDALFNFLGSILSNNGCVFLLYNAKLLRMHEKLLSLEKGGIGCGPKFHLNDLAKTYTIGNSLSQLGPIDGSIIAIFNI
jgi:hypothetical protein